MQMLHCSDALCAKKDRSTRIIHLSGSWDPSDYDTTTVYEPDLTMVTDKNSGTPPAGRCNMWEGREQGMR